MDRNEGYDGQVGKMETFKREKARSFLVRQQHPNPCSHGCLLLLSFELNNFAWCSFFIVIKKNYIQN